jgi:hypothetical protein
VLNTTNKIIKYKVGLLNLTEELGNVSKACKVMGLSSDIFYRYQSAIEEGGMDALFDQNRRKTTIKIVLMKLLSKPFVAYALDYPAHGQRRASNELRKRGLFVSGSGVRSVWLRYSPANFKSRLKALESKVTADGCTLTESQIVALERKRHDDDACGEIETAHPGYLRSQDTFYGGTFKGVGRVYQKTLVDTYSKIAFAKLYTTKTPITSAGLLNDKVLPFFEQHDLPMLRILTDRGTEFCGKVEQHDYQSYLALNDIDHTKKTQSPKMKGICERFHKIILQEFYQVTLRKKIYENIDTIQKYLDE